MNRLYNWVASWLDIVEGVISVLTLCYYRPWWSMSFRCWNSKMQLKRRIK